MGTGEYTNASSDLTGLRYIKTGRLNQSSADGNFVIKYEEIDLTTNPTTDEKTSISNVPSGTLYEETDTRKMFSFNPNAPYTKTIWTERDNTHTGAFRGVIGGGSTSSADVNVMDYVTIGTLGNASDFGDLTDARAVSYTHLRAHET